MANLYAWKSSEDSTVTLYTVSPNPSVGDFFYDSLGNKVLTKLIDNKNVQALSPFVSGDILSSASITCNHRNFS